MVWKDSYSKSYAAELMKFRYIFIMISNTDSYLKGASRSARISFVFSIFAIVTMGLAIASITNSPLVYAISAINSTAITTTALLDNIETKKVRVGSADMTLSTFLSNYQTPLRIVSIALLLWAYFSISIRLTKSCRIRLSSAIDYFRSQTVYLQKVGYLIKRKKKK